MIGRIFSYIYKDGKFGSLVKLSMMNESTINNKQFISFGNDIAIQIAFTDPKAPFELLENFSIKEDGVRIQSLFDQISKLLNEKIELVCFSRFS